MKVAFHFNNSNISEVDFSCIEEGNPGIGGSENSHVLIPTLLMKRGNIDAVLLINKNSRFASWVEYDVVNDSEGALIYCQSNNIDILVFDAKFVDVTLLVKYPDVNVVLWSHNFITIKQLRIYSKLDNVLRIVNVGREYNDLYRDMNIFAKSAYIFNSFNMEYLKKYMNGQPSFASRGNNIVYVGSLIRVKGFCLLAKAWPEIKKQVPDAELFVIGSGKLYDRNAQLGEWGIADDEYEKEFIPYLLENGKISSSVHFMGLLGIKKFEIMKRCRVGIPNPSGTSETFGNGAVEMALMGCNVTTIRCVGYLDSVYNKGNLYNTPKELAGFVIRLLKEESDPHERLVEFIDNNFSLRIVIEQWEKLFKSNLLFPVIPEPLFCNDSNYHNKKLKEWIRKHIPFFLRRYIPAVERFYPCLFTRIVRKINRIMEK